MLSLVACGGARGCGAGAPDVRTADGAVAVRSPAASDGSAAPACPELAAAAPWLNPSREFTLADRGRVLACAHSMTFTAAMVASNPFFVQSVARDVHGFELFVVQYVSETRPGVARAVSGLLYLPTGAGPNTPIVAVDHAASGMGPTCGPSRGRVITDAFGLQLAGMGYAVIAPDYAGMGVDNGMTSFLVGQAEAAATLDGVRALRAFRDPRFDSTTLGKDLFLLGYSQGAHAALFAHGAVDESLGLRLLGTVAFSPSLGDSQMWLRELTDVSRPMDSTALLVAMSLYSHALYYGEPPARQWLSAAAAAKLPQLLHDECLATLPRLVAQAFPRKGDLYRPEFLESARRCTNDGECASFEPFHRQLLADQPGDFKSDAPVLILKGMADPLVRPETISCTRDRLRRRGTPVSVCGYPGADHWTIVGAALADAMRWMEARRAGKTLEVCDETAFDLPCSIPSR